MSRTVRRSRVRRGIVTLVLVALGIGPLAAAAHADAERCRRELLSASAKLTQTAARAIQKCRDGQLLGKIPAGVDCRTETKARARIDAIAAKMRAAVDQACGGADGRCATPADNVPLTEIGWDVARCPDVPSGACDGPIAHCGDVAACVACVGRESMATANAVVYGDFVPSPDGAVTKCQRTLGRSASSAAIARSKALRTCTLAVLTGKAPGPCPDATAAAKISGAEAKRDDAVCRACGGADRSCGGIGDFAGTDLGFTAACPDVTVPGGASCAAAPVTLDEVASCIDCVEDQAGDCASAIATPTLGAYPAVCGFAAALAAPASADAGVDVVLDASASQGDIVQYVWTFGQGAPAVTTTTPTLTHRFGAVGVFELTVTVTASAGATRSASRTIAITRAAPPEYLVKPVYFVPSDRTPYAEWEPRFQTAMTLIERFYADNLRAQGFGYRPLNYAQDGSGAAVIQLIIGQHPTDYYLPAGVYDTGGAQQRIQAELEPQFDMERHTLLIIADVQWYDPAVFGDVAPWTGGRAIGGRGGMAFVGNPFPWLGRTVDEQIAIFFDETMDPAIGPRPHGDNASILLGGMAHELGHAFGAQHSKTPADLMTGAAWVFRNHFIDEHYGPAPNLARETALVFDNSAMFRADAPFADETPPTIQLLPGLVAEGQPFAVTPLLADGGAGPALFQVYFNGVVADSFDVRGMGASFAFPYVMADSVGLPEGNYPFGYILYDGDSNRFESDASFQVVASIPPVPPAVTVDPAEWVWAEDARASDSYTVDYWAWQTTIKASGNLGLYQKTTPAAEGFHSWFGANPNPMPLGPTDRLTAWVYIVPGSSLEGIALELGENIGGGIRAYWGDNTFDWDPWSTVAVRVGDLPPAGSWVHLSVPAASLGIATPRIYVNGGMRSTGTGTVFWDRFGKKPGS